MLTLYLICLSIGGTLLALSLLGGGDVDADIAADIDVDTGAEVGAVRFFNLRNMVFFAAFFGLTGTVFSLMQLNAVVTAALAGGIGLIASLSIHHVMAYLREEDSSISVEIGDLTGCVAEVLVDIGTERPGKISLANSGRTIQIAARPHAEAMRSRFSAGDQVVIVAVDEGVAQVASEMFLV